MIKGTRVGKSTRPEVVTVILNYSPLHFSYLLLCASFRVFLKSTMFLEHGADQLEDPPGGFNETSVYTPTSPVGLSDYNLNIHNIIL